MDLDSGERRPEDPPDYLSSSLCDLLSDVSTDEWTQSEDSSFDLDDFVT